ncbi:MAG: hypothetical protein MZV49_27440 [Rhodopseudomonas palustris]|nr:hypothetical protein [Rhodopseudomonas palustris]
MPADTKILISPFFGGSSIGKTHFGVKGFLGFDIFEPLVIWIELLKNPEELANYVQKYFPLEKQRFLSITKSITCYTNGFSNTILCS